MPGEAHRSDRLSAVTKRDFSPDSLVGSFFLSRERPGWQGCVVAEPKPGMYLVELFSWMMGDSTNQQLVPIEEMHGWTFYDEATWMENAYETYVSKQWDREREEKAERLPADEIGDA